MNSLISPFVFSETAKLSSVVLGRADTLQENLPSISFHIAQAIAKNDQAQTNLAVQEFQDFEQVLRKKSVEILRPQPLNVPEQMNTRDIGFVIGETFFISRMANPSRQEEIKGIEHIYSQFGSNSVKMVPEGITIEGGDIIVDKGIVYVGIGNRTTNQALTWLQKSIDQQFKVVPVYLNQPADGEVLHLDCCFMPVGENSALIWEQGMSEVPTLIKQNYPRLIPITAAEQKALGTNVLNLSPQFVVVRHNAERIAQEIKNIAGVDSISLSFDQNPKTGGSFRCSTLPLVRGD